MCLTLFVPNGHAQWNSASTPAPSHRAPSKPRTAHLKDRASRCPLDVTIAQLTRGAHPSPPCVVPSLTVANARVVARVVAAQAAVAAKDSAREEGAEQWHRARRDFANLHGWLQRRQRGVAVVPAPCALPVAVADASAPASIALRPSWPCELRGCRSTATAWAWAARAPAILPRSCELRAGGPSAPFGLSRLPRPAADVRCRAPITWRAACQLPATRARGAQPRGTRGTRSCTCTPIHVRTAAMRIHSGYCARLRATAKRTRCLRPCAAGTRARCAVCSSAYKSGCGVACAAVQLALTTLPTIPVIPALVSCLRRWMGRVGHNTVGARLLPGQRFWLRAHSRNMRAHSRNKEALAVSISSLLVLEVI